MSQLGRGDFEQTDQDEYSLSLVHLICTYMSRVVPILLILPLTGLPAEIDPREIVQKSVDKDAMNFRRSHEFTYQQTGVTHKLDDRGNVKETESSTYDIVTLHGEPYSKQIAKDGKPLPAKDSAEVEQQLNENLRKRAKESPEAKAKRIARQRRDEEEARRFMLEIPEAFVFRLLAEEQVDGHDVWVIDAEPRAGFKPKAKRAELLKKFRGRLWIDKKQYQWVRVEGITIDTVSFGFVLARLGKGAKVTFEQRPVVSETWLPHRATMRLDARLALLKSLRMESEVTWSGYRKFSADSRIVSVEEIAPALRQ